MGLYISAAGILNAQQRINVTAHNVANLSTSGYRAQRALSSETRGGGVRVTSVDRDDSPGPLQFTGQPLDVAASNGFFRVRRPDGTLAYTRDGHFGLNAQGQVVTSDGALLEPAIQVPAGATGVSVSGDGAVYANLPGAGGPQQVGRIEVYGFTNPDGLHAIGGNLFQETAASGQPVSATGQASFEAGMVQGSNVNLVSEHVSRAVDRNAFEANIGAFRAQGEMLGELLDLIG